MCNGHNLHNGRHKNIDFLSPTDYTDFLDFFYWCSIKNKLRRSDISQAGVLTPDARYYV